MKIDLWKYAGIAVAGRVFMMIFGDKLNGVTGWVVFGLYLAFILFIGGRDIRNYFRNEKAENDN